MWSRRVFAHGVRSAAPRVSAVPRTAFRRYATPAEAKPPIELFGVDGVYASALYTAAAKQSTLDPTAKALDTLHKTFTSDPKLAMIMKAPSLSDSDKSQLINELVRVSGAPASDQTVKNFLNTLSANHRLGVLQGVCEKFGELMSAYRGEVEMRVTSAAPLDQRVLRQLEAAVGKSRYVGQGKKLKVVTRVEPDIRGGLVVEIGDRTIDLSVSSKMNKMNKMLHEAL